MPEGVLRQNDSADGTEEAPGWSYYISALDSILDAGADECEILADQAEQSVDEVKKLRKKIVDLSRRLTDLVNRYGLKPITVGPDDAIGMVDQEIDSVSGDIIAVFASPSPTIEQLHKALPSTKQGRSIGKQLELADEILEELVTHLSSVFIDFPKRIDQISKDLRGLKRLEGAERVLQCKNRLNALQKELVSSRKSPQEMSLSWLLSLVGNDSFIALKASVTDAEKESKQIEKEEERLRKQRQLEEEKKLAEEARLEEQRRLEEERKLAEEARLEEKREKEKERLRKQRQLEEERRLAEEARLEEERKQKEEALAAEKMQIKALLRPRFYLAPLAALAVLFILWFWLYGWGAFAVSMTTLFLSTASGLLGVFTVVVAAKNKVQLPKSFLEEETLLGFGLMVPAAIAVLQFLGAILLAVCLFFGDPKPHPFLQIIFPLGSWARFFGFIILGPLACFTACTATVAAYYLALIKPMQHRMATGTPLS